MKRIFLIGILWLSALAVTYAQQDTKAKKLLDQTTEISHKTESCCWTATVFTWNVAV